MLSCQYKPEPPRNISNTSLDLWHQESKRVQLGTSEVDLLKHLMRQILVVGDQKLSLSVGLVSGTMAPVSYKSLNKGSCMFIWTSAGDTDRFVVFLRPLWDGGPHDVHHHIPSGSLHGASRLEAKDLGLQLVLCVSSFSIFYIFWTSEIFLNSCMTVYRRTM